MVVGFVGNDVTNATYRVVDIPGESWYHVHVNVEHGLASNSTRIHADIDCQ